jgi:hypothetical protein
MVASSLVKAVPVEPEGEGETLPRLSRTQFWACWATVVALFFFDTGPIWRHPWDMGAFNDAVLWSYVPIPLLVGGCLLGSRRLSLRAFFLDTLEITLLKYAVTFAAALVLWGVTPAPKAPPPVRAVHVEQPAAAAPAIVPTRIDPAQTGSLGGVVVDEQGRPAAGALVFVASGLSGYVFAPPREPVTIGEGEQGVTPSLAVAVAGQRVLSRSTDGRLHTAIGDQGGEALFNVPLLRSGDPTELPLRQALGLITLSCNAHRGEAPGRLLVLSHPFFTRAGADGRFQLRGVPAGHLRLAALREGAGPDEAIPAGAPIDLAPGGTDEVQLTAGR